ncbi:nuclease [Methylobacterium sp. WL12]|uniref:nuclease n=1 Tax=Methylobacterium sp. WL12 TaxID=2603890 RepID=UPI0011C966DF|nr:nuclease [Methylobacterium sp. WL12]TXM74651.1 nuclease [Methylobacterium sp. WL12]
MTTPDAETLAPTERPVLGAPERATLRGEVQAEIARRNPKPVAVRTLQLLAEAAVEPSAEPAGYRVVDRHGRPRRHAGSDAPLTLAELVDEIQARHPALFLPAVVPPAIAPVEPEVTRDAPLIAGAAEMRAATARLVETGSERARALAERSTEQGRALAESAVDRVSGVRSGMAAWLAARRAAADRTRSDATTLNATTSGAATPGTAAPNPVAQPAWRDRASQVGASARDGIGRVAAGLRDWQGEGESVRQHRRWLAGGTAAALLAVLAAGLVVGNRAPEGETPTKTPTQADASVPNTPSPDPVTPPPETADTVGLPEPPPAPAANAISGKAEVIDTATVRVAGKVMHLFGVEWVRGGQADELSKYLAGRPVTCTPVPGSENVSCTVEGRDLSEVVLFNGGGRASPEASPELVAAEDHARTERIGVWKR